MSTNEAAGQGDKMAAMFAELQKKSETGLTTGLSHVTDDQKTYKQERESKAYDFGDLYEKKKAAEERRKAKEAEQQGAAGAGTATTTAAAKKAAAEPVFGLTMSRFQVKNFYGGPEENQIRKTIDEIAVNQSVVMTNCEHTVLQIKGKFNSLTVMNCSNVAIGFENVVSTIEVSNCKNVTVHVSGVVRSCQLDKSSEVNIILADSEVARNVQLVTSVCSSVNVRFPDKDDAEDLIEKPLPEQYISTIVPDGKGFFKLVTKPSDN